MDRSRAQHSTNNQRMHDPEFVATQREATPYSRVKSSNRYSQVAQSRRRRRRIITTIIVIVAVLVVAAAAVGISTAAGWIGSVGDRLNEGVDEKTWNVLADQQEQAAATVDPESNLTDWSPFYMLLIGADADEARRSGEDGYGADESNYRSDSIILTRVDPAEKLVTLVSIHRDTWYPIDGVYQKINAAYAIGGISKTIQVISEFAGVPISHYAEIDMTGLAAMVDALGGIEVDVPYEINDEEYTGHLDAGLQTLNGEQTLILVRSRHAYDDLGDGDRYRAAHQRLVIAAILEKFMDASVTEMINFIDVVADYVTTDFTLDETIDLALAFRGIDLSTNVYSTMNPTTAQYENYTWYEISNDEAWHEMMAIVDAGGKPPTDSGYISVTDDINSEYYGMSVDNIYELSIVVKDGTDGSGRAQEVIDILRENGLDVTDGGMANVTMDNTGVIYSYTGYATYAATIAELLGGHSEAAGTSWIMDGDLMVVVGWS